MHYNLVDRIRGMLALICPAEGFCSRLNEKHNACWCKQGQFNGINAVKCQIVGTSLSATVQSGLPKIELS